MTLTGLIIFLVIGAVAGWIAGQIMRGGGFGLVGNIVVGVIGALIGGWLFGLLGITASALRRSARPGSSTTMMSGCNACGSEDAVAATC